MQVTVKFTNICEATHELHPEPLDEVFEDVLDVATDKEWSCVMLRMDGHTIQLNRACVLKMEVAI